MARIRSLGIVVLLAAPFWAADDIDRRCGGHAQLHRYRVVRHRHQGTRAIRGRHADTNAVCSAVVNVEIEGGPFDSPLTVVSLAGTVVTAAGFAGADRPLFRRVRS